MRGVRRGTRRRMTNGHHHRTVKLEGVPAEEAVDAADAADRVDHDPAEERNWTEDHRRAEEFTEDS